ncbi:NAD(P)-binding protein [Acidiphilium sp.]|uniref:NAD(P)-binding protein n=1 Tax=Acidiphilium sp. TaxID=527 RepID=UPI003D078C3D
MTRRLMDATPQVDLMRETATGPARTRRPVFRDHLPPCNVACPAGENIQEWLGLAQSGHYRAAWEVILRDNPFPAVHGRVCYHPCESACNRSALDEAVGVHAVERYLGDLAIEQNWPAPPCAAPSGKRVLVVGAGPSGLAAAYHLARRGHDVSVHEAGPLPGGMLHFGIPAYRLPRDVLLAEVRRIEAMGVNIVLDRKVDDVLAAQRAGGFDAVFVAIGAQASKRIEIPARDAVRVIDAIALLHEVAAGERPLLGRRVVIYGGGNTAMDAARTARRLGASDALIVYRRDQAHMPAHEAELADALSEGIKVKWLSTIKTIDAGTLTVEMMRLNAAGRPEPTGTFETLTADAVVLALGQETDAGLLHGIPEIAVGADGVVSVDATMMTGRAGIFAGGDAVPCERTVTTATGHGKKAASHIDAWLRGTKIAAVAKHPPIDFAALNLPIFADAAPRAQPVLRPDERLAQGFAETTGGLDEAASHYEARRCLSCGNCFECDQCFAACPENAIVKLGPGLRYRIDMALCTGCAVCFEQCPCHAIEMIPEPVATGGTS